MKFKHFNEFVDKEVEELAVEILVILIRHSIFLKSMNKMDEWVNYIGEVLNLHQDFFESIKTNPIYNILGQLYIEFIEEYITDTVEQQQKLENDKKKESEDKKAKLKKRKEMAMLKMNEKRKKIIKMWVIDTETSSNNDSISYSSEQECFDIPKWQKWYENLISDNFTARPYGYLFYIVKIKLYFDSIKQTYYELKKMIKESMKTKFLILILNYLNLMKNQLNNYNSLIKI